jgi:hypothetical protein
MKPAAPKTSYGTGIAARPPPSELKIRGAREARVKARAELRRLIAAHRRNPRERVRTSYFPHEGGTEHEDLALDELVQTHLDAIGEGRELGDRSSRACLDRLERQLRSL